MLRSKPAIHRWETSAAEVATPGLGLIVFLLITGTVLAFPAPHPRKSLVSGLYTAPTMTLPAFSASLDTPQETGTTGKTGPAASVSGQAAIQAAIDHVHSPSLQVVAQALGLKPGQIGRQAFEDSPMGMETISGLAGGDSVLAVKWHPAATNQESGAESEPEPRLYLLSWNGRGWQSSYLTPAKDALELQVLPAAGNTTPLIAVIIFRGISARPYPVIFRFRDHRAALVWDSRSDSSLYTAYEYGSVQFEKAGGGNVPVMIAAGRADPGLLVFPAAEQLAGRGFQEATVYAWRNDGYVPLRTEYTHNRDYTIYRFIAALHLHDFKAAYSLIDPAQFLKTKKPSLKLFRERIQNAWPEFTDDRIFEVPAEPVKGPGSHAFILRLGHGKLNVYHPTFTASPPYRLSGLERNRASE